MMALLLHGIQRRRDVRGPGEMCSVVQCGPLSALCSAWPEHGAGALAPECAAEIQIAAATRHHEILLGEVAQRDTLPVRFGSVFSAVTPLRDHMSAHRDVYLDALARLAGLAEYALRVEVASAPPQPAPGGQRATDGRSHLRHKRRARDDRASRADRRRAFVAGIATEAAEIVRDLRNLPPPQGRVLDLALLADRTAVDQIAALVARHRDGAHRLGLDLSLAGPWPVYSFCDAGRDAPAAHQERGWAHA